MVATKYLKVGLLKGSAKELILKAVFIYLANDVTFLCTLHNLKKKKQDKIGASRCIEKYKDEDPSLDGSRELQLIEGMMKTLEEKDVEGFEQLLYNYNKITPFDKLKTKLLVKIKEQFQSEVGKIESAGFS